MLRKSHPDSHNCFPRVPTSVCFEAVFEETNLFITLGTSNGSGVTPGMLVKPWISPERTTPAGSSAEVRPSHSGHLADAGNVSQTNHGIVLQPVTNICSSLFYPIIYQDVSP